MKILKYGNRKCDDIYWDASTDQKEKAAFRKLFELLDTSYHVYDDVKQPIDWAAVARVDEEIAKLTAKLEDKTLDITDSMRQAGIGELRDLKRKKHSLIGGDERELYHAAKEGDDKALRNLLRMHKGYEYEDWDLVEVHDPL